MFFREGGNSLREWWTRTWELRSTSSLRHLRLQLQVRPRWEWDTRAAKLLESANFNERVNRLIHRRLKMTSRPSSSPLAFRCVIFRFAGASSSSTCCYKRESIMWCQLSSSKSRTSEGHSSRNDSESYSVLKANAITITSLIDTDGELVLLHVQAVMEWTEQIEETWIQGTSISSSSLDLEHDQTQQTNSCPC